ncbi:MAG: hypothetical protein ACT4NY_28540 [Pseudonocardiales bacterium]
MERPGNSSARHAFSTAAPVPTLPPESYPPGVTATEFEPGDFILLKAHGLQGWLIKLGQKLRIHGADRKYVDWAHAALIVDRTGRLIEAVGSGVREWSLDQYQDREYKVFRIKASDEDRRQVVAFAKWALSRHCRYGPLTILSIGLSMLTGSKLTFFIDGQFVCSGLVASALERTTSIFNRNSANITAADLAKYFDPAQRPYMADSGSSSLPPNGSAELAKTVRASWVRDRIPNLR